MNAANNQTQGTVQMAENKEPMADLLNRRRKLMDKRKGLEGPLKEDIDKIDVFNRYGTKIYELNDYVDQWCGDNQDGEIMPVGTYFYIIYFNSSKEPITSWIYLNY